MTLKRWIFFAILVCLFLTGCSETLRYDANLFKPDQSSCWPCQLYAQTFQALSNAIGGSLPLIASNSHKVLLIMMAFWLLFKVLPWVFSFNPPKFNEDFVEVIKVCFKAYIVTFFLTDIQNIYDIIGGWILQPIGDVFLYVSEIVLLSPSSVGVQTQLYSQSSFLGDISSLLGWNDFYNALNSSLSNFHQAYSQTTLPNGEV